MKLLYPIRSLMVMLVLSLLSCNQEAVTANSGTSSLTPAATTSSAAKVKAEGRWQLVSILSGWTGKTDAAVQNIELVINKQLQAIYYEGGKEVSRYQYVIAESPSGVRYLITEQVGQPTLYLQREGNFRVSDQQLIVGDTGVDGNDYTFKRL